MIDSESDDTSGSPNGEPSTRNNYRIPIKPPRNVQTVPFAGYETLLVSDTFKASSSTESNDVSPKLERKPTPKHLGGRNMHRPGGSR